MIEGKSLLQIEEEILYIENINKGFENFKHICFFSEYEQFNKFLKTLISTNEKSFFDFYFYEIEKDEQELFLNYKNCGNIVERFNFEKDKIYFNVDDTDQEIINFIATVSFDEMLFSSFYFKNPKMTLWTNYNKQFILFFENDENIKEYKKIASNLGIKIVFEKQ